MPRFFAFCRKHEKTSVTLLFLTIAIAVLSVWLIARGGGYFLGWDSDYHISSVAGLAHSSDGKIIPGMYDDKGYGEGIFYPQLSHYFAAGILKVIEPFGFTAVTAMKISYIIILTASGLTMYWFMKKMTKGKIAPALVSSIFYMIAPYHLSCIMRRDAMAETTIYIFLPVVLASLYHLWNNNYRKFLPIFVIGVAGCLVSHLVMTMYFAIICALFVIVNWRHFLYKKSIASFLLGCVLALLITSPFLAPLAQHKLLKPEGYLAFSSGYMYNDGYADGASHIPLQDFVLPIADSVNDTHFTIDASVVMLCIYALIIQKQLKKDKRKKIVIFCLVSVVLMCAAMLGVVSIRYWPASLQMVQFAWRLSTFVILLLAISLGVCLSVQSKNVLKPIIMLVLASAFINAFAAWPRNLPAARMSEINSNNMDYIPMKTFEHSDEVYHRGNDVLIISSNKDAVINDINNNTPSVTFNIETQSNVAVELPRLFYYGYEIQAEYEDGTVEQLQPYESNIGLIAFDISRSANVSVRYTGGAILLWSRIVSGATIVGLGVFYFINQKRK